VCVLDRVYLQFSLDHVHILSPSVAMVTHLRQKGEEPGDDVTVRKRRREEDGTGSSSSVTMTADTEGGDSQPCVSMVIRVEEKEGVAWKNVGAGSDGEGAGLIVCFSVRSAVIGPVVSWGQDPKNGPMTEREVDREAEQKVRDTPGGSHDAPVVSPVHLCVCVCVCVQVVLVLSGASARWFPVLQSGCFYRLVAANTQVKHL